MRRDAVFALAANRPSYDGKYVAASLDLLIRCIIPTLTAISICIYDALHDQAPPGTARPVQSKRHNQNQSVGRLIPLFTIPDRNLPVTDESDCWTAIGKARLFCPCYDCCQF